MTVWEGMEKPLPLAWVLPPIPQVLSDLAVISVHSSFPENLYRFQPLR